MRSPRKFFLWVTVCLLSAGLTLAAAEEKKGSAKREERSPAAEGSFGLRASRAPIEITSDSVEADQKQNIVTFKGNVVAKQEDVTVYGNTMVVYYDPATKKMKEVVVLGNVRIVQLDRRATSQRATFYQDENKVVLDGDAVLREGESVIRGERVTYYGDEQRALVEPGKGGRVSTTIIPKKEESPERRETDSK